jgi:transcriptional regulator with GAF, ATPase, and Fis domain
VTFNAAGQSESLLEDQLFGHVRGAFTGADRDREGVFEYADKGTVFLDEIGDMPLPMQPKLLRVLETGEIVRLGSNDVRKVDLRLVSATNRDLRQMTSAGTFREDLYSTCRRSAIDGRTSRCSSTMRSAATPPTPDAIDRRSLSRRSCV